MYGSCVLMLFFFLFYLFVNKIKTNTVLFINSICLYNPYIYIMFGVGTTNAISIAKSISNVFPCAKVY